VRHALVHAVEQEGDGVQCARRSAEPAAQRPTRGQRRARLGQRVRRSAGGIGGFLRLGERGGGVALAALAQVEHALKAESEHGQGREEGDRAGALRENDDREAAGSFERTSRGA